MVLMIAFAEIYNFLDLLMSQDRRDANGKRKGHFRLFRCGKKNARCPALNGVSGGGQIRAERRQIRVKYGGRIDSSRSIASERHPIDAVYLDAETDCDTATNRGPSRWATAGRPPHILGEKPRCESVKVPNKAICLSPVYTVGYVWFNPHPL